VKIFIIAGEASGDMHAGNLAKALKASDPSLDIRGWGGEKMEKSGVEVIKDYRELAFMGFVEVIANLRTISKNFKLCKAQIAEFKPDAVVLIDYPGFNLRMAKFIKARGIKVFYYISPQVWAWKESRVKKIKKFVDRMFVILPFEKDFFAKHDFDVDFVGHPLLDVTDQPANDDFRKKHNLSSLPIIALIPGSRKQEIKHMLPVMNSVRLQFADYQFVIAGVKNISLRYYNQLAPGVVVIKGDTYNLFRTAEAGLVTSGTATLEAGLHNMPQVVCYKGGTLSYYIARALVKVKYISLVNLIMDREVVKELIQGEMTASHAAKELKKVLNPEKQGVLKAEYKTLQEKLGGPGASERTANAMLKILNDLN